MSTQSQAQSRDQVSDEDEKELHQLLSRARIELKEREDILKIRRKMHLNMRQRCFEMETELFRYNQSIDKLEKKIRNVEEVLKAVEQDRARDRLRMQRPVGKRNGDNIMLLKED